MPDPVCALPRRRWLALSLLVMRPMAASAAPAKPLQAWQDAITRQDTAVLAALIASGAGVNCFDDRGSTPLYFAALADFVAGIPLLLAAGARHDIRNIRGDIALHHAGPLTQPLLVAAGANTLARNGRGRLPLHTAHQPTPALLAAGVDPRDNFGMTPLHVAAFDGNEERVVWLLERRADPTLRTTALFDLAAQPGWTDWDLSHRFEPGQRPVDLARWQHDRTKWSSGRYRRTLELLDAATPWRAPWR